MRPTVIVLLALPDEDVSGIASALHVGTGATHFGKLQNALPTFVSGETRVRLDRMESGDRAVECANCSSSCRVWSADFLETARMQSAGEIHGWIHGQTGEDVIVDSSGDPEWLSQVVYERKHSRGIFAVYCVRNPVDASCQMRSRTSYPLWRCAEIWRSLAHDVLRTCSASNIPLLTLQLEDFSGRKQAAIERIAEFCNLDASAPSHVKEEHPLVARNQLSLSRSSIEPSVLAYDELAQVFLAPNMVDLASLCGYNGIATIKELLEKQMKPETA